MSARRHVKRPLPCRLFFRDELIIETVVVNNVERPLPLPVVLPDPGPDAEAGAGVVLSVMPRG